MIKTYTLAAKPGIIMGNLITTTAGFALASRGHFDAWLFCLTLFGLAGVIASACVINNYIDREADQKMARTASRAIATGAISEKAALLFASVLGAIGFFLLSFTNWIALSAAAAAFFIYVGLYSFWKYKTSLATLVGSVAGAMPPVVGYCAVSGVFDFTAALFFIFLVLWQMPHFFAIALYRMEDYRSADIPVWPIERGIGSTKRQTLYYVLAFILSGYFLFKPMGTGMLLFSLGLTVPWAVLALRGFWEKDEKAWARGMFRWSLIIITALSFAITLRGFL